MTLVVAGYELRQRGVASAAVAPNEAIRLMNSGAALIDLRTRRVPNVLRQVARLVWVIRVQGG